MLEILPGDGEHYRVAVILPFRPSLACIGRNLVAFAGGEGDVFVVCFGEFPLVGVGNRGFRHWPVDHMPEGAVGELLHGTGTGYGIEVGVGGEEAECPAPVFAYGTGRDGTAVPREDPGLPVFFPSVGHGCREGPSVAEDEIAHELVAVVEHSRDEIACGLDTRHGCKDKLESLLLRAVVHSAEIDLPDIGASFAALAYFEGSFKAVNGRFRKGGESHSGRSVETKGPEQKDGQELFHRLGLLVWSVQN